MKKRSFWMVQISLRFLQVFLVLIGLCVIVFSWLSVKMMDIFGADLEAMRLFVILQLIFAVIVSLSLMAIYLVTYRAVGALPRLEKVMERILEGDYSLRLNVRDKDILANFIGKINKLLDILEKRQNPS